MYLNEKLSKKIIVVNSTKLNRKKDCVKNYLKYKIYFLVFVIKKPF